MIKVYNNIIPENDRLEILGMLESLPDLVWNQSIFTDDITDQIRDYLPAKILGYFQKKNIVMSKILSKDFEISIKEPVYGPSDLVYIDRRKEGYSLGEHQDIPSGSYSFHLKDNVDREKLLLSAVYYLNDNFSGGELYFKESDTTYFPKAGDMVVFPSSAIHGVKEITSGMRYSSPFFFATE